MEHFEKELDELLDKLFESQRKKIHSFVANVVKREVKSALKKEKSSHDKSDKSSRDKHDKHDKSSKKRTEKSESSSESDE